MRLTMGELRQMLHASITEGTLPAVWYHGSPHCCMQTIADYRGNIMFLTDLEWIAQEYRIHSGIADRHTST